MKVACEHCGAQYNLDEDNITGRGVRITCPSCSHVFTVYRENEELEIDLDIDLDIEEDNPSSSQEEVAIEVDIDIDLDSAMQAALEQQDDVPDAADEELIDDELLEEGVVDDEVDEGILEEDESPDLDELPPVTEEALAALDVNTLNFQKVGLQAWKVKSNIGLVYEFSDYKTLKKYIREGRVRDTDPLSHDGENWLPINEIDNLERHFCKVYLDCLRHHGGKVQEKSQPKKPVTERTVQPGGGMDELASALADAQAEVDGTGNYSPSRSTAKARRPRKRKGVPVEKKSSNAPLLLALAAVAAIVVVWQVSSNSVDPPVEQTNQSQNQDAQAEIQKPPPAKTSEADALRAEIQEKIMRDAQKAKEASGEVEVVPEEGEEQLIVVVPEEILRQQAALEGVPNSGTATVSKTVDHADVGRKAVANKDWALAVSSYQKAYQQNKNPKYKEMWGYALYRSGQSKRAKPILQQALKEGALGANKWLGFLIREEGDKGLSNQYFNSYLASNPSDADQIKQEMLK